MNDKSSMKSFANHIIQPKASKKKQWTALHSITNQKKRYAHLVQAECPHKGKSHFFSSVFPKEQTLNVILTIHLCYKPLAHSNKRYLLSVKSAQLLFFPVDKTATGWRNKLCHMLFGTTYTQKLKGYLDSFLETKKHSVLNQKADLCKNLLLVEQRGQSKKQS